MVKYSNVLRKRGIVSMRALLTGNGVNIEFGGKDYFNTWILVRLLANVKRGKYNVLFSNRISAEELVGILNGFVDIANRIILNGYDELVKAEKDYDELILAVNDFKRRYKNQVRYPDQIGIEDWLLLVRLYFIDFKMNFDDYIAVKQGFQQLFLDAIWNDGHLQKICNIMRDIKGVKKAFSDFDCLFTLNYDNNLENLTGKSVCHLHGDFCVLADSENPNTVWGNLRIKNKERIDIPVVFKHCYCNALMEYSGELKLRQADNNAQSNKMFDEILELQQRDADLCAEKISRFKNMCKFSIVPKGYEHILAHKIENKHLKGFSEYYFDDFKTFEGQLSIIGIASNNDSHVFSIIQEGIDSGRLTKVIYYYHDAEGSVPELPIVGACIEKKSVVEFWSGFYRKAKKNPQNKSIRCNNTKVPFYTAIAIYEAMEYELANEKYRKTYHKEQGGEWLKTFRDFSRTITCNAIPPEDLLFLYFEMKNKYGTL